MARRLDGKVAITTGATSGIGAVAAELFAAEAARVAAAARKDARGVQVVSRIAETGATAALLALDFDELPGTGAMVYAAASHFDGLDFLYNSAGGSSGDDDPLTQSPEADFWCPVRVDLFGTWQACRHAIPHMQASGGAVPRFRRGALHQQT